LAKATTLHVGNMRQGQLGLGADNTEKKEQDGEQQ
jgi:hypothetical protein